MLRARVLPPLVALPVLATAAMPAAAAPRVVVAPGSISPRGIVVQGIEVATGGNRTAVVLDTYRQGADGRATDFALLARVGEGTRPGRLQRLPGGGSAGGVDVAVGADGTAVAAWVDDKGRRVSVVRAAVAAPGRPFGSPQTIARVTTRFSHQLGGVVVTARGRSVVTWLDPEDARGGVHAAIREPGRRFGPKITLDGSGRSEQPVTAATPWGTVLVSWSTFPPPPTERAVVARTLSAGAQRFRAPVTLTVPPAHFPGRLATVGGTGGAGVAWQERASSVFSSPKVRVLSTLTRGGRFVTGRLPFAIAELTTEWDTLQVVLPGTGRTVAAWADMYQRAPDDPDLTSSTIRTSTRPSGGRSFSPVRQLSANGWLASPPALAALGDQAVAAWAERRERVSRLRIAVRADRGGWTAPQTVPGARAAEVYGAGSRQRAALAWLQQTAPGAAGTVRLAWVTR